MNASRSLRQDASRSAALAPANSERTTAWLPIRRIHFSDCHCFGCCRHRPRVSSMPVRTGWKARGSVTLALMPTIYAVLDDWRENVRRLFRQARAPRVKPGAIEATAAAIVPE